MSDKILIEPQPHYKPFRIHFANRGDEWWYNERRAYRECGRGDMLIDWKCPFGVNGEPEFLLGKWYWVKSDAQPPAAKD